MKKKIFLGLSILFVMSLGIPLYFYVDKTTSYNKYINLNPDINNNNFLTLMLEQDDGTYKETTSSTWPGEDYLFNNDLSYCQNDGELIWDDENKIVKMSGVSSDNCFVYFDKYILPQINDVTTSASNNSIIVSVSASPGTNDIYRYYYSINNGEYFISTSNTYTFSGLSAGQIYQIRVYVVDSNNVESNVYSISVQTDDTVLLADYIKSKYTSQGANGLYYHTSSLANSAADNSYRYAGSNPNNYVCFGSDTAECSSDNIYRIIGVFGNEVKLIKNTSYGNYVWDSGGSNAWYSSTKPDIRNTLNTTFLNSLSSTWQNKIATHVFKVGGMSWSNSYTAKQYYDVEVGNSSSGITDSMKIGSMYLSDYGFAVSNGYWTDALYDYINTTIRNNNWMFSGVSEWTISRNSGNSYEAFYAVLYGYVYHDNTTRSSEVRPCFYLTSSTEYISGSGTESDPIRIN